MKKITAIIVLSTISMLAQGQAISFWEQSFLSYLEKNEGNLNPIEGAWNIESKQEFYRNDTLLDKVLSVEDQKIAIMMGENKFETFDMDGEKFNIEFTKTDVNGVYLYRYYFPETSSYSKTQAVISKRGEMEYTFNYPEEYMRVKYNDMFMKNMRIVNILHWTKLNEAK